jgi:hypothetical protein
MPSLEEVSLMMMAWLKMDKVWVLYKVATTLYL